MKKISFITLLLVSQTFTAFAQLNQKSGIKNKWGCALAINSIQAQVEIPLMTFTAGGIVMDADGNMIASGNRMDKSYSYSIIPKYHLNNDILLRLEFGVTSLHLLAKVDEKYDQTHVVSDKEIRSKIFRYAPGFQWTFMKTKKIESYCGMTASYINYKGISNNSSSETRDMATDTLQYLSTDKEFIPGGFAVGIGALAGFNIYLFKQISLGAEFSSSALYYKSGGEQTVEGSNQTFPNPAANIGPYTFANSYSGFKMSKVISSFNVSFWF